MSEWIKWEGGERPVFPDTWVEVHLENSDDRTGPARSFSWYRSTWGNDIVRYRVLTNDEFLSRAFGYPLDAEPEETSPNAHYRQGEIECIDAIRAALTDEEWRGYCKGNILKYTWREKHKGGNDTLVKAQDYLRWAIAGKAEGKR